MQIKSVMLLQNGRRCNICSEFTKKRAAEEEWGENKWRRCAIGKTDAARRDWTNAQVEYHVSA